jgi:hypothetical protein
MNGWPFLIARGRRRGYRTLLAPDFLIPAGDYGAIEATVRPPGAAGQVDVAAVTTRAGRDLTVAYTTYVVTTADLAVTGMLPRDEHSRPLTLLYGYVCESPWTPNPTQDELRLAREQALDVYRRFLVDEDGTTVSPSRPRPVRMHARSAAPEPAPAPTRAHGLPRNLVIVAATVAVIAVFAVLWLGRSGAPGVPGEKDCLTGTINDGVVTALKRVDCANAGAQFTVVASVGGKTQDDVGTGVCDRYANTLPAFWPTENDKGAVICLASRKRRPR